MERDHYAIAVDGSRRVNLRRIDPADTAGLEKDEGLAELERLGQEFSELGNLLTYAGKHALLVVLQGRDASGKDGSIRKVLEFSNVQNAFVAPFKVPTTEERAHDFLWRAHKVTPGRGHIALFNRSYYEDVIAARVHRLVPERIWKGRYAHINAFERLLTDADVIVLKFYLHISHQEQRERLLAREKDPRTAWKLNPEDWRELALSDEVDAAYQEAIDKCRSHTLPWYVVPADRKWFRNLAIMQRIVLALRPHKKAWLETLKDMAKTALKEIRALHRQTRKR
jgi:PPK2 family polyphosphate:nucleotide phosphotransferase